MLIHSHLLTATGISATATMGRTRISTVADMPQAGVINSIEFDISAIASGATKIEVLTLSWIDADRRYIVNKETNLSIEVDAGSSGLLGSYELAVTKEFNGVPSDATGIWVGIKLDTGTATVNVYLGIRGHA
tara:strand:- start:633 stop:1028 length:396 start_codon:yes stop_codon:yes gene_type:complete